MTKGQNELNFALGEGFKLARVITRGAGLSMAQQFEALSSKGAQKAFTNECFVCGALKKGVWGVELLSRDFKHRVFVPKDKIKTIDILAQDLRGLQNTDNRMQRTEMKHGKMQGEVFTSYFWRCEVASERSALVVRERSEKQARRKEP